MSEEQAEIDFKSYDPKQIAIFSTALTNPQFLIKFILGIIIFLGLSFLSIGVLYIFLFPLLFLSLYVFFAVISVLKSITNPEPLQNALIFQPLGDESKISKYFYTIFLIMAVFVLLFNLEFSRRPQIMEMYGYPFILLLNLCLLSGIFLGSKAIIETHNIALIKKADLDAESSDSSKTLILGLSGNQAMRLWTLNIVILFAYTIIMVLGLILFLVNFESSSMIFLKIAVDIDGYSAFLYVDFISIVMMHIYLGFFIVMVKKFYSSLAIVRKNFSLVLQKLNGKMNDEKILIRGLELYLTEK